MWEPNAKWRHIHVVLRLDGSDRQDQAIVLGVREWFVAGSGQTALETAPGIAFSQIRPSRARSASARGGEEHLAHRCVVRALGCTQTLQALRGQRYEQAAPVVGVRLPLDESEPLEAVHRARDPARTEVAPLAELADRQRQVRRQCDQCPVGVDPDAVCFQQALVERAEDG